MSTTLRNVRLSSQGGIVPLGDLRRLSEFAMVRSRFAVDISSRQEILVRQVDLDGLKQFPGLEEVVTVESTRGSRDIFNVTTTSPSLGIVLGVSWLSEGVFQEILDQFTEVPKIRVALSDITQSLMPSLSGDVIFVATEVLGYWQIVLQCDGEPVLFTNDAVPGEVIPEVVRYLETELSCGPGLDLEKISGDLHGRFEDSIISGKGKNRNYEPVVSDSVGFLPSDKEGTVSLGVHCALGEYEASFLQEICVLARRQGIKKVRLGPRGGLIIASIPAGETRPWRRLLGRYGVSLYPQNYAPYMAVDNDTRSRKVAGKLFRELERKGCQVSGLQLAIGMSRCDGEAAIRITRSGSTNVFLGARYVLEYNQNFDSVCGKRVVRGMSFRFGALLDEICSLVDNYNRAETSEVVAEAGRTKVSSEEYECSCCLTHYAPEYGDPFSDIAPGVRFEILPESWSCPVCDAGKEAFVLVVVA